MIFQYINVCPVPREMLKTSAYGLGFQHLPRDLANVNAWKTMFDPYIILHYRDSYLAISWQKYATIIVILFDVADKIYGNHCAPWSVEILIKYAFP